MPATAGCKLSQILARIGAVLSRNRVVLSRGDSLSEGLICQRRVWRIYASDRAEDTVERVRRYARIGGFGGFFVPIQCGIAHTASKPAVKTVRKPLEAAARGSQGRGSIAVRTPASVWRSRYSDSRNSGSMTNSGSSGDARGSTRRGTGSGQRADRPFPQATMAENPLHNVLLRSAR